MKERNDELREDSGSVEYSDTLTSVFYQLLRDHIPAGQLEKVVREVAVEPGVCLYSNGFLAQYANNLANYVVNIDKDRLKKRLDNVFEEKTKPKKTEVLNKNMLDDELEKVANKINEAVENITEEEKKEYDEREARALEEIKSDLTKKSDNLNREEVIEELVGGTTVSPEEYYRKELKKSMGALDDLHKLVPTDSIREIIHILKNEIDEELTDDAKKYLQTRESILKEKAEENASDTSKNKDEQLAAVEYVKEQMADSDDEEKETLLSRGNLKDVLEGKAFPEALEKVFSRKAK